MLKRLLNDEDKFYNNDFYNEIKILYDTSFHQKCETLTANNETEYFMKMTKM